MCIFIGLYSPDILIACCFTKDPGFYGGGVFTGYYTLTSVLEGCVIKPRFLRAFYTK